MWGYYFFALNRSYFHCRLSWILCKVVKLCPMKTWILFMAYKNPLIVKYINSIPYRTDSDYPLIRYNLLDSISTFWGFLFLFSSAFLIGVWWLCHSVDFFCFFNLLFFLWICVFYSLSLFLSRPFLAQDWLSLVATYAYLSTSQIYSALQFLLLIRKFIFIIYCPFCFT